MAKKKRKFGMGRRMLNAVVRPMAEHGWGPSFWYMLSVRGRKSGLERSTPVAVMELGGRRWLVASYGVVEWVRNVRAADGVTLMRGGRAETFHPIEVGPTEAVPVLREYLRRIRVARPYFDATVDSPDGDFAVEASRHPVFRLDPPRESPAV
jgi:deazaflavin-dependent oxidoreductase (nitroreductase family)